MFRDLIELIFIMTPKKINPETFIKSNRLLKDRGDFLNKSLEFDKETGLFLGSTITVHNITWKYLGGYWGSSSEIPARNDRIAHSIREILRQAVFGSLGENPTYEPQFINWVKLLIYKNERLDPIHKSRTHLLHVDYNDFREYYKKT